MTRWSTTRFEVVERQWNWNFFVFVRDHIGLRSICYIKIVNGDLLHFVTKQPVSDGANRSPAEFHNHMRRLWFQAVECFERSKTIPKSA